MSWKSGKHKLRGLFLFTHCDATKLSSGYNEIYFYVFDIECDTLL